MSNIAVRVDITTPTIDLMGVSHEARQLACRINAPVTFLWGETNQVIYPQTFCPPTCPYCEGRNPKLVKHLA